MSLGIIVLGVIIGQFLWSVLSYGVTSWIRDQDKMKKVREREAIQPSDAYKGIKNKGPDGTIKNKIGFGEIK